MGLGWPGGQLASSCGVAGVTYVLGLGHRREGSRCKR